MPCIVVVPKKNSDKKLHFPIEIVLLSGNQFSDHMTREDF